MKKFYFVLFFAFYFSNAFCFESKSCIGGKLEAELRQDSTGIPVLNFSFEFTLKKLGNPRGFANLMGLYNIKKTAFNDSFAVTGDLNFSYDGHKKTITCVESGHHCEIKIPNGSGIFKLPVSFQEQQGDALILMGVVFYNGKMFRSKNGLLFDEDENRCLTLEDAVTPLLDYTIHYSFCCSTFEEITLPDIHEPQCVQFSSNTVIERNKNMKASVESRYSIRESEIFIEILNYDIPKNAQFYLQPNENSVTCSSMNQNCTQLVIPKSDYGFDFSLMVTDAEIYRITTTAGILIKQNGIFMTDDNKIFTRENACWKSTFMTANDTTTVSSLCCDQFAPSSTMDKCVQYESRTTFRDVFTASDAGYLQTKYTVNSESVNIHIANFTASTDSLGFFHCPSSLLGNEVCKTSTTNPDIECEFGFIENKTYEFSFRTSFAPEGFNLFVASQTNQQLTQPEITVVNPCVIKVNPYNYPYPPMEARTTICCISTIDGPWPEGSS